MPKTLLKPCMLRCGTIHRVSKQTWKRTLRRIGGWIYGIVKCIPSCPSTLHGQMIREDR